MLTLLIYTEKRRRKKTKHVSCIFEVFYGCVKRFANFMLCINWEGIMIMTTNASIFMPEHQFDVGKGAYLKVQSNHAF